MIYIDFNCHKSKLAEWRVWCKENNIDEEEECRTGYIERGSGVMDYYFRLLCIAAYRSVEKSSQDDYGGYSKGDICRCLLEVCPADSGTMRSSQQDSRAKAENNQLGLFFPQGFNRYDCPPKVDMAALESDHGLKLKLRAIGLDPMADWVSYGCQSKNIPGSIIIACAKMFTKYLDDVPTDESHLAGTPYSQTKNMEDNLDDNGCVDYAKVLEPCFRNTALFGEDSYGEHC